MLPTNYLRRYQLSTSLSTTMLPTIYLYNNYLYILFFIIYFYRPLIPPGAALLPSLTLPALGCQPVISLLEAGAAGGYWGLRWKPGAAARPEEGLPRKLGVAATTSPSSTGTASQGWQGQAGRPREPAAAVGTARGWAP